MATKMNRSEQKEVYVMSDSINYLCVKAKEIMDAGNFEGINLVYDSVLNNKAKKVSVQFDTVDTTVAQVRDLLSTSDYKNISIKHQNTEEKGNEEVTKKSVKKEVQKKEVQKKDIGITDLEANASRRGAPALTQEVLDFRYDILSDYVNNKITAEEAMKKLNVTEGVFRNMVSDFNKCKRDNRKKAFGKNGIIKRTYKLYTENKITSEQAAENIGISVATFLKWYKKDTGNETIGRGTKRVKK